MAPLVATQFSNMETSWHYYYIISAGLSAVNVIGLFFVFKLKKAEGSLLHTSFLSIILNIILLPLELLVNAGQPTREVNTLRDNVFKQIFRLPALHSLAIWAVIYVGVEVTIGGWIVTFIEQKRAAGSNAGYVSSGFFAGLMVRYLSFFTMH